MGKADMKELRHADTQELSFEAWKRSYIACSALLYGQFADSQKSRVLALKRSYMGSAVLEVYRSADINEFCFQASKTSDMDCVEVQGGLFADSGFETVIYGSAVLEGGRSADIHEFFFKLQTVQIWNFRNCKVVYLLIVRNGIFKSRKVQIIAVTSRKRVELLMFTKC